MNKLAKVILLVLLLATLFLTGSTPYDGYTRPELEDYYAFTLYHNQQVNRKADSISEYQTRLLEIHTAINQLRLSGHKDLVDIPFLYIDLYKKLTPVDLKFDDRTGQMQAFLILKERETLYTNALRNFRLADSLYDQVAENNWLLKLKYLKRYDNRH